MSRSYGSSPTTATLSAIALEASAPGYLRPDSRQRRAIRKAIKVAFGTDPGLAFDLVRVPSVAQSFAVPFAEALSEAARDQVLGEAREAVVALLAQPIAELVEWVRSGGVHLIEVKGTARVDQDGPGFDGHYWSLPANEFVLGVRLRPLFRLAFVRITPGGAAVLEHEEVDLVGALAKAASMNVKVDIEFGPGKTSDLLRTKLLPSLNELMSLAASLTEGKGGPANGQRQAA